MLAGAGCCLTCNLGSGYEGMYARLSACKNGGMQLIGHQGCLQLYLNRALTFRLAREYLVRHPITR